MRCAVRTMKRCSSKLTDPATSNPPLKNSSTSAAAVSAVSRQPQRIAADSSGRMNTRKNGLV